MRKRIPITGLIGGIVAMTSFITTSVSPVAAEGIELLRARGYAEVYVLDEGFVRRIPTAEVFNAYGFDWNAVRDVDYIPHERYPKAELMKADDNERVYFRYRAQYRIWIPTPDVFHAAGYSSVPDEVQTISALEMNYYEDAQFMTAVTRTDNGNFTQTDQTAYRITPFGTKRPLKNFEAFESYSRDVTDILHIPYQLVEAYPDTELVRKRGDDRIFALRDGKLHWITSPEVFAREGYAWERVEELSEVDFASIIQGEPIE